MKVLKKEEMFQYLPENGRVLDAMRKQLISVLGENRAKGFLIRYGWNCGYDFANYIFSLDLRQHLSKIELIQLVSNAHSELTNMDTIVFERTFNSNDQSYYSEGIWRHSQEAIKYISMFGLSQHPVCHTLTGFISSLISAIVGETVIFKELTCRAQGHDGCHWIAQSVSKWGDEINYELSYFSENNSLFELESAFEQLQAENDMLSRALSINERLSNKIIDGAGFKGLIETLAYETRCDVLVENINFQILYEFTHNDYNYLQDTALIQELALKHAHSKRQVIKSTISCENGQMYERLTAPIYTCNQLVNYLTLIKHDGAFSNLDSLILEIASALYALQTSRDIEKYHNKQLIHNELLTRFFIMGTPSEDLIEQIRLFGYQIEQPQYVFILQVNGLESQQIHTNEQFIDFKNKKIQKLYEFFSNYQCDCLIATQLHEITLLVPEKFIHENFLSLLDCAEKLMAFVFKNDFHLNPLLAISNCCNNILELKNHRDEAKKVMQLMQYNPNVQGIYTYGQLGALAPILCKENYSQLLQFADKKLRVLQQYDEAHQSELLTTLYWYLYYQGHLNKTSLAINSSVGSIRYRLKRIEELTNCVLQHAQQVFDFHIAIQMYLISGRLSIN